LGGAALAMGGRGHGREGEQTAARAPAAVVWVWVRVRVRVWVGGGEFFTSLCKGVVLFWGYRGDHEGTIHRHRH
jgi:hypothetical protein